MQGKSSYIQVEGSKWTRMKLNWSETYDVASNTSSITVELYAMATKPYGYYLYTYYANGSVTVDGHTVKTFSDTGFRIDSQDTWVKLPGSPYVINGIQHNTDGTKNVTIGFNVSLTPSGKATSTNKASQNVALTTIPRASTLSAADTTIDQPTRIHINAASDAFTHSLFYFFEDTRGYLKVDGGDSAYEEKFSQRVINFDPQRFGLASHIPTKKSGICKLTLKTYSGGTLIGTSESQFTISVPPSYGPSITGQVVDSNASTKLVTGDPQKLVRYMSTATATASTTAYAGARVVSCTVNGVEVSGNSIAFPEVETGEFVFQVTDSRGYMASITINRDLIPYIPLSDYSSVTRLGADTGKAILKISGNMYSGWIGKTKNTVSVEYSYDYNASQHAAVTESGNSYSGEVTFTGWDYKSYYFVTITVTDALSSITRKIECAAIDPLIKWNRKGVTINKPLFLADGTELRYIKKQVQGDGWAIREWSDGTYESVVDGSKYFGASTIADVLGYTVAARTAGFSGIIPAQFGEGAQVPTTYCSGLIICNGRPTVVIFGYNGGIYTNAYIDSSWTGWKEHAGSALLSDKNMQEVFL